MKQVLRKGLKDIVVDEVPDPLLAPGHVLVRPLYSLISSGTETASIHQEGVLKEVAGNPSHLRTVWDAMMATSPLRTLAEVRAKFGEYAVLGYSGAGVVAGKDSRVEDLETGGRVAYGGEGTGHGETILVGRNLVAKVPAEVPFEHACFATLGSIAMNAVRTANIGLGDVVAVTGGRGADCVIVAAASKSPAPAQQALEICRDRGRIVIVGAVGMEFPWNEMYLKEIQLFMSRAYGPGSYDPAYEKQGQDYPFAYVRWTENRNMQEFLRLVSSGRISLAPLITPQYPLEEAAQAYQTILDPASGSLALLLRYPAADQKDPIQSFTPRFRVEAAAPVEAAPGELQVALVGAGNLARWHHLPNLKKIPKVHLRAVHSASGARGKSYARRFGAAYCCSDYEEILKDAAVDVVLIATRNPQHASQALAAIQAGKHVFVEKPMALTAEECRELCAAVARTGKQLTVGFNRRFAPFYLEQKKHLARRAGPAVVTCRINSPGISGSYWMADRGAGGAILGEACHFVDLMYWLPASEPMSVSAYSLPAGQKDPIGENNMVACFRFADGSIGNLTYTTAGSKTSGGERVEVFAQVLGVFTEDFKRLGVRTSSRSDRSSIWAEKGYAQQLAAFFAAIREGRPAEVTALDGARATIGCLAMLESARTLAPVTIDLEAALEPSPTA